LVARAIYPHFLARPMLHVELPVTLVPRSIHVSVDAVPVGLVVEPLPLEDVAVNVPEFAPAASLIEAPEALISRAIRPDLHAEPVLHVAEPLAFVNCAVLENDIAALFNHLPL